MRARCAFFVAALNIAVLRLYPGGCKIFTPQKFRATRGSKERPCSIILEDRTKQLSIQEQGTS